jgi:diguanylate cyclase (GGDEF)-like protein/PAS domain S-box-containing protein
VSQPAYRILVVDDDAGARLMARVALETAGYEVLEAGDGSEALEAFRAARPDLVLLDVMMPRVDGFEACARIRAAPGGLYVPVLMLTGLDDLESINRAFEVGATDFVSKPMNYLSLGFRIRYMLRAKQTADALRESQGHLARAQRMARLGHWEIDAATGWAQWSEQVCAIFGFPADRLGGRLDEAMDAVHPDDRARVRAEVQAVLRDGESARFEFRVPAPEGGERVVESLVEAVVDEQGRVVRLTGTSQDITERSLAEKRIRQLAYFDQVTGLPNRTFLREHLKSLIGEAGRRGRSLAVLYLDLDRFKRVNDTLGHSAGDELLREVAERYVAVLRAGDSLVREPVAPGSDRAAVAHVGGDEFIALVVALRQPEDGARVARRLLDALKRPILLEGREVVVSASVGIAVYPDDGADVEALLRNAEVAMYHAKDLGRDSYQFYTSSLNARASERLALEGELRRALERNEFCLHYQPKLDLASGEVVAAEALIRWQHPELGMVPPLDFIGLAEETGLILPIGRWVLEAAASQMRRWQQEGRRRLRLSVNLSVRQFRDPGLFAAVRAALDRAGLDWPWLELEITESMLMGDTETSTHLLRELKGLGVSISVDDFGTGYSSLSYLTRLPLDLLKVDRSFVRDLLTDASSQAVTRAIVHLAHSLGLRVVAEGVESGPQLQFLRDNGCDEVQGYLLSVPLPAQEFGTRFLPWGAAPRRLTSVRAGASP